MRAILLLVVLFAAAAFAGHHQGHWMNRTLEHLSTSNDQTNFDFIYPVVPVASSPYHFEIHLTFAEVYDEVVVDLNLPTESRNVIPLQYIIKEKGIKAVIVFQDMTQSLNGWAANNLACGAVFGTVTSKSKIASIGAALKVLDPTAPSAKECAIGGDEMPRFHRFHRGHVVVLMPILLITFLFCCCFCCCLRARRCRRQQCKPVEEAYPADAVTAAVAAEQAAVAPEDFAQGHVMYPFPVMAVPIDGGVQYALVPAESVQQ